jgi:signal transduction histidine kinase
MTRPGAWPLTLKVPLFVALLMTAVGGVISYVVAARLAQDQESHLRELAATHLDGIATAVIPHVIRQDVWETFDVLDRSRRAGGALRARHVVIALPDRTVLAASDPHAYPVGSGLPQALIADAGRPGLSVDESRGLAWYVSGLREGSTEVGSIIAEIDIAPLLAVRARVITTLVLVNGALTLLLAGVGWGIVRHMLQPMDLLDRAVEGMRDGSFVALPVERVGGEGTEFGRLFARFNTMARAVAEREALVARLAEEGRIASLGRIASGMAHEVNNPLGGMMNVIDTLRSHGEDPAARQQSLALLERGLVGIRNVVRAALVTYKGTSEPAHLERGDLDDMQYLLQHEARRRRLTLEWSVEVPLRLRVDGSAVRQVVLNLLLNACAASPPGGRVGFAARSEGGRLSLTIEDDGPGLPAEAAALLASGKVEALPGGGHGLGIWAAAALLARMQASARVAVVPGGGTRIVISVPIEGEFMHAVA